MFARVYIIDAYNFKYVVYIFFITGKILSQLV